MSISKQLHLIATNPRAQHDFVMRGVLPKGEKPEGPLVDLLKAISPRDRAAIIGLTVDERLGYTGSHPFHTASQAFRWIHPDNEVFGSFPAESWRNKRVCAPLFLDELLACAARAPQGMEEKYPRLCRPKKAPKP